MRVLLGVLSLMILLNIDGALYAGSIDDSTLREEISKNFNPYDISYEAMGASAFLGTTIVSNYAGSAYFFGTGNSIRESYYIAQVQGVFTKLVSIGALLNLGAFFLFIKTNKDNRAKGVLVATIIVALITIIIRFI